LALAFLFPIPAASTGAAWDYGTQVRPAQRPAFAPPGCVVVFEDYSPSHKSCRPDPTTELFARTTPLRSACVRCFVRGLRDQPAPPSILKCGPGIKIGASVRLRARGSSPRRPVQLEIARTATNEEFPGTAFSTVVVSRAWKYGGTVLWLAERSVRALRSSVIRSGFVRYSIAA
jgi:hypothetical protein